MEDSADKLIFLFLSLSRPVKKKKRIRALPRPEAPIMELKRKQETIIALYFCMEKEKKQKKTILLSLLFFCGRKNNENLKTQKKKKLLFTPCS